jgi:hypothetical protein
MHSARLYVLVVVPLFSGEECYSDVTLSVRVDAPGRLKNLPGLGGIRWDL